ncbi:AGE family epimerase/isomerase [Pedobacter duraquae]|uniref:Cellobiose 2-epimerase n=1 Tax=Pedobacter duraquae TaxID=425511 RepID=A0A4R6IPK3_9SPHI|nr:AGE family epimerase/isomerase [Pedobacter duraquae]TDO24234.1 mannobiose 2-epimerase [Pedobacter duraquae]
MDRELQIATMESFRDAQAAELKSILDYWGKHTLDELHGGYIGQIDEHELAHSDAAKGSVLNARILWSFSAAYNLNANPNYLELANRSFDYIATYFVDKEYGGVYWTVDHLGNPLDTKKQIYAIAFTIYGLAEYYKASRKEAALELAKSLFSVIETHSFDQLKGGYLEAFTRDWQEIPDLRLSDKDANEKKTMNTLLHILEAYTCLYSVWPDGNLRTQLIGLISVFNEFIIGADDHLQLFFDENWNLKSQQISYGHDIEASWLLLEAAKAIGDASVLLETEATAVRIAKAALKGMDPDGGMNYEYDPVSQHLDADKHWWVQAEAMVGFFNAWELSGEEIYLNTCDQIWNFIQDYILDKQNGEWIWGVHADHSRIAGEDKVGLWKCPYHNSRACIELIHRTDHVIKKLRS